jgi:hypothetical protein
MKGKIKKANEKISKELNLHMKKPCNNCPYRKDVEPFVRPERMEGLMKDDTFVCHKTIQGEMSDRKQCAGHMLLLKNKNLYYNLAEKLGIELGLSGEELVYDSEKDCLEAHKKSNKNI